MGWPEARFEGFKAVFLLFVGAAASAAPPPAGPSWSAAHPGTWCDKGALVSDLGKSVPLAACKAACAANATCGYICHADQSDGRCMLYASCPAPMCGRTTGQGSRPTRY